MDSLMSFLLRFLLGRGGEANQALRMMASCWLLSSRGDKSSESYARSSRVRSELYRSLRGRPQAATISWTGQRRNEEYNGCNPARGERTVTG